MDCPHPIKSVLPQRRYDMRHEMLTQHTFLPSRAIQKGTLSQHFVMHVVPPEFCLLQTRPSMRSEGLGLRLELASTPGPLTFVPTRANLKCRAWGQG